jgi:hypothetical protein
MTAIDLHHAHRFEHGAGTGSDHGDLDGMAVVPHIDQIHEQIPPWTRPIDPAYSRDRTARPTVPAEGAQVELRPDM